MTEEQKKTLAFAIYALAHYNIPLGEFLERSIVCINDTLTQGKECDRCSAIDGFYLGTLCPKCNKPWRAVKTN